MLRDASLTAVDLPRPIGTLDHMQLDQTGYHQSVAAIAADLMPSLIRNPGNPAVVREPLGSAHWSRLTTSVRRQ